MFFPLNKPIQQLECINSRMFSPLYSIKRMLHNVITFNFPVLVFNLQSFVINPWCRSDNIIFRSEYCIQCGSSYRLQMWIKMQHSVLKVSNNEGNVINPANLPSLWSTPLGSQRITYHKDRTLA